MNAQRFFAASATFFLLSLAVFLMRWQSSWTDAETGPAYVAADPATLPAFGPYGSDAIETGTPTELVGPYRPINIWTVTPTPIPFNARQAVPTPIPPTPTPPPVQAAAPPPAPATGGRDYVPLTDEEMVALLSVYDWSVHEALETARCESRLRWWVVSSTGIHNGLFQVTNGSFDPAENIRQAYAKYVDGRDRRNNRWYHWNQFGGCGHFY